MKMNKILLSIVAASVFVASCNTSLTVQKKQHSNGYYVSLSTTEKKDQKVENSVATKNQDKKAVNAEASASKQELSATAKAEVSRSVEAKANAEKLASAQKAVVTQEGVNTNTTTTTKASKVKEAVKAVKAVKAAAKESSKSLDDNGILLVILAILLSPIAVGLATNWNTKDLVINILLWFFCLGIGGIIHAFVVLNREGVI